MCGQYTDAFVHRFWLKVDKNGPIPAHRPELGPCWVWTKNRHRQGYGFPRLGKTLVLAHRVAWELLRGTIPAGMWVLHRCDNPPCVRPEHLFLGTRLDNIADMVAKGRQRGGGHLGEKNAAARLTVKEVQEIRALCAAGELSQSAIGVLFGVTQTLVSQISRRKIWRHIA